MHTTAALSDRPEPTRAWRWLVLVFVSLGMIAALAGLLIALSPRFPLMMAGRFVLGLGSEPLIVAITTALAKWFKGKELSFAMAINLTIARLGSVAADNSRSWASGLFGS